VWLDLRILLMPKFRSKVDEVSFVGGLYGLLFTSPKRSIESRVKKGNDAGWRLVQMHASSGSNLLIWLLRLLLLIMTLGIFTFSDGMYLVFEKEIDDAK
jgi:hypothetical protein